VSVVQAFKSFAFESNRISKVRCVEKWVLCDTSAIVISESTKLSCNCVCEVRFTLSLESVGVSSTVVFKATSERCKETTSFLVALFKKHAIIISLDLDWDSILLLLNERLLLLNDGSGWLLNQFDVFFTDISRWLLVNKV